MPTRAYAGDAGLDLASCERVELAPGERALVGTGLAVAIPDGYAGFVQPRSGLAAKHGISIVNTPGLVDSGYRGELRVALLNTDPRETFVVEPGMRIAQLVVVPSPRSSRSRSTSCPSRSAASAASARRDTEVGDEPRVRVSALLRWQGRVLLCRQEKPGKEYWLLPGGGVEGGETLDGGAPPRARRGARTSGTALQLEGPIAVAESIAPDWKPERPPRRPHHLRRRPLAPLARGRRERTTPPIRGARLFSLDELRGDRRAPADEAVRPALAAGRPGGVPRLAVGALRQIRGGAAVLLVTTLAAGTPAAAPGCSPPRAAETLTVRGHCYIGTDRADAITGSAGGDLIDGWAGADAILGMRGDDRVFAGSENDVVFGGAGDDLIDPALGRDLVHGGAGNDLVHVGGGEPDRVWCGTGHDVVYADRLDRVARDCEKVVRRRGYSTAR